MTQVILRRIVNFTRNQGVHKLQYREMSGSDLYSDLHVKHDEGLKEFLIELKKGDEKRPKKAVLQYDFINSKFVDLQHTVVPKEFRGHGVAKILAKTAFDYFTSKEIDIQPTCTYLQKFYRENPSPEYEARVKWAD